MRQATESSGALVPSVLSVVQTHEEPPTHFKTTKFTSTFNAIVESYGIAGYREINPGMFFFLFNSNALLLFFIYFFDIFFVGL